MPFLRITHQAPLDAAQAEALAAAATTLIAQRLGKDPSLTAVLVEPAAAGTWAIAGAPIADGAHLEATITAGTNSAAEKAAFIADARALLRRHGGASSAPTYVVVREIAAEDWGYDGVTQAARRLARG